MSQQELLDTIAASPRGRRTAAFFDERLVRLGRRPLPFVLGDFSSSSRDTSIARQSTVGGLELLAEVLRQSVALKYLS